MLLSRLFLRLLVLIVLMVPALAAQNPAAVPAGSAPDTRDIVVESAVTRVSFDEAGTRTEDISARLRVNTPAGVQQAGTVTIPFRRDATTLRVGYVRVRKPDGSVVETPTTATFDLPAPVTQAAPTYSDLYVKHINVQALQPGDVLEYAWEAIEPSLIPGHFWYSDEVDYAPFGGRRVLEISWPSATQPIVKSLGPRPTITTDAGRTSYRWQSSETEPSEDTVDSSREFHDVQVSSFREWADVGDSIRQLWRGRAEVTPEIRAKAGELTAGLGTADEKARALYRHVATNIRYVAVAVGLGRIQPNSAATVLANGFGDCKDKHILLEALLRAVGIEATPVLIGPGVDVDADVPSLGSFSHVITLIDRGLPAPVWIDTTLEVAPFGFLIDSERDATVLTVPPDGVSALVTTPVEPVRTNVWRTETDGVLSSDGQLRATVREQLTGDVEVLLRSLFRAAGRQNWIKIVSEFPLARTHGGIVTDVAISPPEETDGPFQIDYRYAVESFVDWKNGTLNPPVVLDVRSLPVSTDVPQRPLELGPAGEFVSVARVTLPDEVEARHDSSPAIDLDRTFARYQFRWTTNGRVLEVERRLATRVTDVAAADVVDYRAFIESVREAPYSIRIRRLTPWAWSDAATIDWYDGAGPATTKVLGSAATIGRRGDYQEAIAAVRGVLQVDPESDAAWQMLAWAQFASGARERAIETLRNRAPSATTSSVLKYYALRLVEMGRREDAIGVWRMGHTRFPDDREFALYLGDTLVAAGQHAEAVAVLRPLADVQRASARYQALLGRAYLGAGDDAAGTAALLHSAGIDDSAAHLNNVAWALADRGLALDEARRLAERSVMATTAEVNHLRIETAGPPVLSLIAHLAERWNTFGWVLFRRGENADAGRYLEAAWQLSQRPIHATHLAEFHDATNNGAAALRYRAFAESSDNAASARAFLASDDGARARVLTDARNELERLRTYTVPAVSGVTAPVDVLLIVSADERVGGVAPVGGGAAREALSAALAGMTLRWPAPDTTITQVMRRGRVTCEQGADTCTLVLQTAGSAAVLNLESR